MDQFIKNVNFEGSPFTKGCFKQFCLELAKNFVTLDQDITLRRKQRQDGSNGKEDGFGLKGPQFNPP